MRELRVRVRFTKACLGNQKQPAAAGKWPVYLLPRGADRKVRFDPSWWRSGLLFAAKLANRHQDVVGRIAVDGKVYSDPSSQSVYRRPLPGDRYVKHECFPAGMSVELHMAVPEEISDVELRVLLDKMGEFRGISPFGHRDFGFFVVERIESWESVSEPDG